MGSKVHHRLLLEGTGSARGRRAGLLKEGLL